MRVYRVLLLQPQNYIIDLNLHPSFTQSVSSRDVPKLTEQF